MNATISSSVLSRWAQLVIVLCMMFNNLSDTDLQTQILYKNEWQLQMKLSVIPVLNYIQYDLLDYSVCNLTSG